MKKTKPGILFFILIGAFSVLKAQPSKEIKPKLVVGIVIDQMRADYIYRYYDLLGEDGFKKLIQQGFNCKNTNFNYVPTYTGPGHASIFTGTTPAVNGIISNNWYVRSTGRMTYVTADPEATIVGSTSENVGHMSPKHLLSSTITDELRMFTNRRSKVIGVALKDRSAILPAGHLSNGSFWFDDATGNFVTSSFYMDELPSWIKKFNKRKLPEKYLSAPWKPLYPLEKYTASAPDDNPYEGLFPGETKPVFPHMLPAMYSDTDYGILRYSPGGNTITKDLAIAAIEGEKLGNDQFTDFLTVSFSSTDYVGHLAGPQSVELEDMYLRLDKDIADLLSYLEKKFGKNGFLVFLTADHGASYVPAQLMDLKMPAGYFTNKTLIDSLQSFLQRKHGNGKWVSSFINQQIYLNHKLMEKNEVELDDLQDEVANYVLRFEGVSNAWPGYLLNQSSFNLTPETSVQNGYYIKRSGDVSVMFAPNWISHPSKTGTTHGTGYSYDTHVPLLWYGWHIPVGETADLISIMDIAPTISMLLNIPFPNGTRGQPIDAIVEQ